MWSIALLINTSTWNEFKHNWKLICLVFLQLCLDEECINQEYQDNLLHNIKKIKSDAVIVDAIKSSDCVQDNKKELSGLDLYNFDNVNDDAVSCGASIRSKRKKVRKLNKP
jgi:hypothetical protein